MSSTACWSSGGGKFGKSRLVPHGPRIGELLDEQLDRRCRAGALNDQAPLFTFDGQRTVYPHCASRAFHELVLMLDLPVPVGVSPPRLHCLRHSFAVGCLLRWYRDGIAPVGQAASTLNVYGACRPVIDPGLFDDHPGPVRGGQPPLRSVRRARLDGDGTMTPAPPLGQLLHSYFLDHLIAVKGLRPGSVRSYRDTMRLLLVFLAAEKRCKITRLTVGDLTLQRILAFLRYLEEDRGNHIRTRNQRLAAIHSLFEYIAARSPEMLAVCQQVTAIPMKRVAPSETHYLERDEVQALLKRMPRTGRLALRDRALILFLYNTGARVQRSRRSTRRAPQPLRALHRSPPRQRRQVENLPSLAANHTNAPDAARLTGSAANATVGGVHYERAATHALRDLQDRAPIWIDA